MGIPQISPVGATINAVDGSITGSKPSSSFERVSSVHYSLRGTGEASHPVEWAWVIHWGLILGMSWSDFQGLRPANVTPRGHAGCSWSHFIIIMIQVSFQIEVLVKGSSWSSARLGPLMMNY